jgi:hypothetical protein
MRLNSNWSIEGQYTNFAKDSFMNTSIAANGTKTTKEDTLSGKSFGVTGHIPLLSFTWTDVATKTDNAITFNCVFILLPLIIFFKKLVDSFRA